MSWPERLTAAVIGLLLGAMLAGCNLEPVHARRPKQGPDITAVMAQIEVEPIPDRIGMLLRQQLQERLAPEGSRHPSEYQLRVRLQSSGASALIGRSETVTRTDLAFVAEFELWKRGGNRPALQGWVRSVHSHDVLDSAFATRAAERAARERGIQALSTRIARRLALHFRDGEQVG